MTRRVGVLVPSVCLAVLVLLGIYRPLLPELLRLHWRAISLLFACLASGSQYLYSRWRQAADPYPGYLMAVFPLALVVLYLQPQRVASDGIFYFAPLRSIVVDFDLDFENEYRVLGAGEGYFHPTETGRLPNNFSIGPAILWSPAYLLVHVTARLGLLRPTGFGYPYFTAIATTTAFIGFLGVVLAYRLASSITPAPHAFLASLLIWLGSFHVWYMLFEPSMSHALAMTSVAAYLLYCHRGLKGPWAFAIAGALGGVVMLIRWQNVLFLPIALFVTWSREGRPKPVELVAGLSAGLLLFFPQLVYWKMLYGRFFLIPQGGGYIDWAHPQFAAVLFSSRHGLLSWSPLLWVALLGGAGALRRARALGWSFLAASLATVYVNASVTDWWAGASFGSRRFDAVLPGLTVGLAVSLGWLAKAVARHPLSTTALLLCPFLVWNGLLMSATFGGALPPDGPVSFRRAAAEGSEPFYRWVGYPFSWPAAWVAALAGGYPPAVYDLTGAQTFSRNVDIRMGETDALHLGSGWSMPQDRLGRTWRRGRSSGAELFVVLEEPADYRLRVELRDAFPVTLHFNGALVGELRPDATGEAGLAIPSELVRSGINALRLSGAGREGFWVSRLELRRRD